MVNHYRTDGFIDGVTQMQFCVDERNLQFEEKKNTEETWNPIDVPHNPQMMNAWTLDQRLLYVLIVQIHRTVIGCYWLFIVRIYVCLSVQR